MLLKVVAVSSLLLSQLAFSQALRQGQPTSGHWGTYDDGWAWTADDMEICENTMHKVICDNLLVQDEFGTWVGQQAFDERNQNGATKKCSLTTPRCSTTFPASAAPSTQTCVLTQGVGSYDRGPQAGFHKAQCYCYTKWSNSSRHTVWRSNGTSADIFGTSIGAHPWVNDGLIAPRVNIPNLCP